MANGNVELAVVSSEDQHKLNSNFPAGITLYYIFIHIDICAFYLVDIYEFYHVTIQFPVSVVKYKTRRTSQVFVFLTRYLWDFNFS